MGEEFELGFKCGFVVRVDPSSLANCQEVGFHPLWVVACMRERYNFILCCLVVLGFPSW